MTEKTKIAVLGGGLGSMASLAWITGQPGAAERYDITVYQMGWRLGGKGASGRGALGKRIEEHGLHIWFGFYENAFRTIRMALEEIAGSDPPPVATFEDVDAAFTPQSLVTFEEQWKGAWDGWPILFPPNSDTPGVGEPVMDFWDAAECLLGFLVEELDELGGRLSLDHPGFATEAQPHALLEGVSGATPLHRALGLVKKAKASELDFVVHGVADLLALLVRGYLETLWLVLSDHLDDTALRRFFILNDLGGTMLVGCLEERLFERGFEAADDRDWAAWLRQHGARECTATSAPVNTVYDLVFGFADGDTERPDFAAGTAIRGIFRMLFTYKGYLMQKMNAGMGDTIFTPFYGLLKQRGVKFEFFHKVDALHLSPPGAEGAPTIESIALTQQVELADPSREYWPLERVKALDCWPSEPLWDQIADAAALQDDPNDPGHPYDLESWWSAWPGVGDKTLTRGEDFDVVVLGIPVGTFPHIASELVERLPAWRRMVEGDADGAAVATTPTLGVQLWLTKTAEQLGWVIPDWALEAERQWEARGGKPLGLSTLLGGYAQPLDTIADLSHLLPEEEWPEGHEPASVQYICGPYRAAEPPPPFDDHGYPRRERERLIAEGIAWFSENAGFVWPNGTTPELPKGLDPMLLVAPDGGSAEARWRQQWWRVNIDPNERYVLSVPRSTASRIACDDTGVANLYVAGDWTWNPVLNAGCVEATVASGMECARVLTGAPIEIAGGRPRER